MSPALAALAALTIGGAVLAVSARDVRSASLGLLVVLLGAPLIADPWPAPVAILVRIAAALLATRLVVLAVRGDVSTAGTRIGQLAEILIAAAAAIVGFGSHGLGAPGLGPPEAQAAGFALAALAIAPLITGRDVFRIGIGALLLLVAASLIRAGLDAPPTAAEELVGALLTIGLGGAIAAISVAARAAGGLGEFDPSARGRGRRPPDAHRPVEPSRPAAAHRGPSTAAGPQRGPTAPREQP